MGAGGRGGRAGREAREEETQREMQKVRREAVQSRCRRRSVGVGGSCGGSHAKVVEKSKKQGAAKRENYYSVTPSF